MNVLLELGPVEPGASILLPQALSHGAGYFVLPYLVAGGSLRLMSRFDPDRAIHIGGIERVTTLKLVPTMLRDLVDATVSSPFETIIYGAAPMATPQLELALERLGPVLAQIYGQSEAPVTITHLSKADHAQPGPHRASAGRPWRSVKVEVVRPDGEPTDPGELGEVVVRGGHLMTGYHERPDLTNEVLRGGFLWTHDMAVVDELGFVYLMGRNDEMINSGGFNIAPKEIEDVLAGHPGVKECVVVGVPDPRWGEAVTAYVVRAPGTEVTEQELRHFTTAPLGFRRPKTVVFVTALPRTPYGKIDRGRLRGVMKP
jgi:acyl-CoA synthetase (AMP-forming)/AMP-acid ligase II